MQTSGNTLSLRSRLAGTCVFALAATLFFGLAYPGHLHYQEELQLFLPTGEYMRDVISYPGGVADLAGRFVTQAFVWPWAGALVTALILALIQTGVWLLCRTRTALTYALSYIPAVLMWMYLCDENALWGTAIALVPVLFDAATLRAEKVAWRRTTLLLVSVPLQYIISGPIGLLFPLLAAGSVASWPVSGRQKALLLGLSVLIGLLCPLLAARFHQLPASELWGGVHYHRFGLFASLAWGAAAAAVVISWLSLIPARSRGGKNIAAWLAGAAVAAFAVWGLSQEADFKKDNAFLTDRLAADSDWQGIIDLAGKNPVSSQFQAIYLNLALASEGRLCTDLFKYPQHGAAGLGAPFGDNFYMPLASAEVYYRLGAVKPARQFVFEIQQSVPDWQQSRRCMERLAEIYIVEGEYELADKHIKTLARSWNGRAKAAELAALSHNDAAVEAHPVYGKLRKLRQTADGYFDEANLPLTLQTLIESCPGNSMAWEYLMACCMLQKDLPSLALIVDSLPEGTALPVAVQEALVFYWGAMHHGLDGMPWAVSADVIQRYERLRQGYRQHMTADQLAKLCGGTYWEYQLGS